MRELIKRKLRITRDIPFNRVCRVFHGPEFRGQKPVQVRWGVKTMVHRLKVTNISFSTSTNNHCNMLMRTNY